jgi:hypothetical protein
MSLAVAADAPVGGKGESLDTLYQKAKLEGRVVVYAAAPTNTEQIVFPAFEKRFPGIKVNHGCGVYMTSFLRAPLPKREAARLSAMF